MLELQTSRAKIEEELKKVSARFVLGIPLDECDSLEYTRTANTQVQTGKEHLFPYCTRS